MPDWQAGKPPQEGVFELTPEELRACWRSLLGVPAWTIRLSGR